MIHFAIDYIMKSFVSNAFDCLVYIINFIVKKESTIIKKDFHHHLFF